MAVVVVVRVVVGVVVVVVVVRLNIHPLVSRIPLERVLRYLPTYLLTYLPA